MALDEILISATQYGKENKVENAMSVSTYLTQADFSCGYDIPQYARDKFRVLGNMQKKRSNTKRLLCQPRLKLRRLCPRYE